MPLTIIDAKLTRKLLPMGECIEVMERAMLAASVDAVDIPPRMKEPLFHNRGAIMLKPGASKQLDVTAVKAISLLPDNPMRDYPAIQGFITLFSYQTGEPVAIVHGAEVTAIRTAAASGLATRLLSREDAASCGIFGTGPQAVTHIDAMCAVRPVHEVVVWGRNSAKTEAFAAEQSARLGIPVSATRNPAVAAECDLVCTVTGSPEPIVKGEWVKPGAHVNLVGAHTLMTREADTALVAKSVVYVDLMESTFNEAGNLMIPIAERAVTRDHIVGEIGSLLIGSLPGRSNDQQITLYNSLGITAQDLFAAQYVYVKACDSRLGVKVDF